MGMNIQAALQRCFAEMGRKPTEDDFFVVDHRNWIASGPYGSADQARDEAGAMNTMISSLIEKPCIAYDHTGKRLSR